MIMAKFSMLKKKCLSPSEAFMITIIHLLTTSLVNTNGAAMNRRSNTCLMAKSKDLITSIIASSSFQTTTRATAKIDTMVKIKRNHVYHYSRSFATNNQPRVRNLPPTVRTLIATMIQQLRSSRAKRWHRASPIGSNIRWFILDLSWITPQSIIQRAKLLANVSSQTASRRPWIRLWSSRTSLRSQQIGAKTKCKSLPQCFSSQ